MTKGEKAKQYFLSGYNCSQAVALSFCEEFGIDSETMLMLASPFGGGMGRLREVCGTVSGMFMVLGLAEGVTDPKNNSAKKKLYEDVQKLADEFKNENGSIICRDLLGLRIKGKDAPVPSERTEQYYKARPCADLCAYAADLIDSFLKNKKSED